MFIRCLRPVVRCVAYLLLAGGTCHGATVSAMPETVSFDSADGTVKLTGYLYLPDARRWKGPRPAIVMLHGRSGVYSSKAVRFDAIVLSARTALWGAFWAERGYIGLYVDTFGPRGHPRGFEAGTNDGRRPPEINELTVRPFDAYQGLKYLRSREDVQKTHVFLQGWSNGGSAALATMARDGVAARNMTPDTGFRAAIALYPGCGGVARSHVPVYRTYAPLLVLMGTADEEVSFPACEKFAQRNRDAGAVFTFVAYQGAQHSYDTPIPKRAAQRANAEAAADSMKRAEAFFDRWGREQK